MVLKETIRSVALRLRAEVLDSVKTTLPDDCTVEDLIRGECDDVPEILTCFWRPLWPQDRAPLRCRSKPVRLARVACAPSTLLARRCLSLSCTPRASRA